MLSKLKLNDRQKEVLKNFERALKDLAENDVSLVVSECGTLYAYNNKNVDCFDAPDYAAYDGEKVELNAADWGNYLTQIQFLQIVTQDDCLVAFLVEDDD